MTIALGASEDEMRVGVDDALGREPLHPPVEAILALPDPAASKPGPEAHVDSSDQAAGSLLSNRWMWVGVGGALVAILAIGVFPRIVFGATNDAVVELVAKAFGG